MPDVAAGPGLADRPISGGGGIYVDVPGTTKKRKVPAFPIALDRDGSSLPLSSGGAELGRDDHYPDHDHDHDHDHGDGDGDRMGDDPPPFRPHYHIFTSPAAKARSRSRALFLRRKAALITLYLDAQNIIIDAQNAILEGKATLGPAEERKKLPDVAWFEKLIPALEDLGPGDWPLDAPGWRYGEEASPEKVKVTSELWRAGFERRKRARLAYKPVERRGLAPEGTFEFELECKASSLLRTRTRNRTNLAKLANELRGLILTHQKTAKAVEAARGDDESDHDDDERNKNRRKIDERKAPVLKEKSINTTGPKSLPRKTGAASATASYDLADKVSSIAEPMSKTNSSQGSDAAGGKKKKGKKKRSVLANQANPHHVDNYRPSRTVASTGDPHAAYPHHANLLFPPSMRFLAARPAGRDGTPTDPVRPGEDDFLCNFCEYALYYGSETLRRKVIRQRRRELLKKAEIKARAKNVADGNGKGRLGKEEEEYSDEEEEGDCDDEDGCGGRCKCGRPLGKTNSHELEEEKKPPDISAPPTSPA